MLRLCKLLTLVTVSIAILPAYAQEADMHWSIDPAAPIYRSSPFLHGYAHGYELGFHNGDLELQMGRGARDPKIFKQFKEAKKHYRQDFGNRESFTDGYQHGFRVGYADAFQGREFRAAHEVRSLSQQWQDYPSNDRNPNRDFDNGIVRGYKAGITTGLDAARTNKPFNPAAGQCPEKNLGTFCQGFLLGSELGYSDGYNNQRKPEENVKTASE